ncbi:unnamed protein product, partial [Ectocarpus sp. 12 AP-2014]
RHHPYPTLPGGMERDGLIALIDAVAPALRLGNAALQTLRLMIAMTRPRAFKSGSAEPCCFASQQEIARQRGVTPARIRAHERELERMGLIERRTKANGARSGLSGCGIYFSAAIARVEELTALRDAREAERQEHARLRGQVSRHRRQLKAALWELERRDGECPAELREAHESWPGAAALQRMPLALLSRFERKAADASAAARARLDERTKTSGRAHENERCHTEDMNEDLKEVPARVVDGQTEAGDRGRPEPRSEHGNGRKTRAGTEKAEKDAAFLARLTPDRLYHLCSEDMQLHLDGSRDPGGGLQFRDFVDAADARARELGIRQSAWDGARQEMGVDVATLCLIILDANTARKWRPVRNPEAYLNAMSRTHVSGELDLVGGLIGLGKGG